MVICEIGIFDLVGGLDDGADRVGADLAGLLVELGAEVLLRLVILSGGYDDRILDRTHDNLRIDAFLAAESVDYVVQFTRHRFVPPSPDPKYRLSSRGGLQPDEGSVFSLTDVPPLKRLTLGECSLPRARALG